MGADAEAIIYIRTEILRSMFRFQTDSTTSGGIFQSVNNTRYVMNYTTPGGFTSTTGSSKRKVLNLVHAQITSTSGFDDNSVPTDNGNNEDLVAFDFVKYLAQEMVGSSLATDLFDNVDQIVTSLGQGGFNEYINNIAPIFERNAEGYTEGESGAQLITNLTRHLLQQLVRSEIGRKRFLDNTPVTVNGVSSINNAFRRNGLEQPVMFADGDRIVFKLTILSLIHI